MSPVLRHGTIPLERAWNTWSSRPAEMVFLPLGLRLTPSAYSTRTRTSTLFPPGDGVRFGRHAADGSLVELDLRHAQTRLAWTWRKSSPFEIIGEWRTEEFGEWGLRFWITLCVSTAEGHPAGWDAAEKAVIVKVGRRYAALISAAEPVQVTGHESPEMLAADYERHGYFHKGARAEEAPTLALRFNLEMMRANRVAVAVADRADLAIERARAVLGEAPREPDLPVQSGRFAGALDAVRDVVAWNTVFDPINVRPYTSISRNWDLTKFGGFGVWLNDQLYAALMSALFDPEVARENLAAAFSGATPDGNLACLVAANDAWVDRTQLPIGAFLTRLIHLRTGARPILDLAYETLARNHSWWRRRRDPFGRGLVSYGTSNLGDGLYRGTSFGARNESGMDNSPIHDEAEYDPATRTLTTLDVGLNSLLALDAEMLAQIALERGEDDAAASFKAEAEALREKIRDELWDETRGLFANRLRSGDFVRSVGPTSFWPLLCGAATETQAERLLPHLRDPQTFGGRFTIPSVARDDPAFADNVYWRGRIWPPLNWLVWHGLRRYGFDEDASRLAEASFDLFRAAWEKDRLCPENFNAETGEAMDQPDTEGFYGWGALMPMLGVAESMDVNPWGGWEIINRGSDAAVGPVLSPVGKAALSIEDGVMTLKKGRRSLLRTNIPGRVSHLRFEEAAISFEIPGDVPDDAFIELPGAEAERVTIAGREIACRDGLRIEHIPKHPTRAMVRIWLRRTAATL